MTRHVAVARRLGARLRGLLGRATLPTGEALLIRPCGAIHTIGMRFALDVRFFDRRGALVREVLGVRPGRWCVWGGWCAACVLECAAGDAAFAGVKHLDEVVGRSWWKED